jgi:hypothetical protein
MAFDDNEERSVMRLTWKLLLAVVKSGEQTLFRKNEESCAMVVAKVRNLTRIERKIILE